MVHDRQCCVGSAIEKHSLPFASHNGGGEGNRCGPLDFKSTMVVPIQPPITDHGSYVHCSRPQSADPSPQRWATTGRNKGGAKNWWAIHLLPACVNKYYSHELSTSSRRRQATRNGGDVCSAGVVRGPRKGWAARAPSREGMGPLRGEGGEGTYALPSAVGGGAACGHPIRSGVGAWVRPLVPLIRSDAHGEP